METQAAVPRSNSRKVRRIDERISFIQFFTFTVMPSRDSSGTFSFGELANLDIDDQIVARIYAAVPESYLKYLE